jgi:hypothetical protein
MVANALHWKDECFKRDTASSNFERAKSNQLTLAELQTLKRDPKSSHFSRQQVPPVSLVPFVYEGPLLKVSFCTSLKRVYVFVPPLV